MSAGDPSHYTRFSDEELVDAMNAGEAEAFAELYQRYRQWVADLALRLTRDHDLSLEIMQEAFIALIRKFPGFELRGRLTSVPLSGGPPSRDQHAAARPEDVLARRAAGRPDGADAPS